MERHSEYWRACWWLVVATVLWGLSFPVTKGMLAAQERLADTTNSAFLASLAGTVRFGIAAIVVGLFAARTLRQLTRNEVWQGAGLAFFGGIGILFQVDGLAHTKASTSAFLTQAYCLFLPIWAAAHARRFPRWAIVVSSLMVLAGVAVLADLRWSDLRVGRGEAETIIAAVFFTGQILWLERPRFASNRVSHFTFLMFAGTALLLAPVALVTMPSPQAVARAYASGGVWLLMASLIVFCTLGAYTMMNVWQRFVTATEAGLIYCIEPVATSLFALFMPAWISIAVQVNYANEHLTPKLLIGGGLITLANVLIQLEAWQTRRNAAS